MPQVPYQPVPEAAPSEERIGLRGVETPGAAFGTNIAEAGEKFGGDVENTGIRLANRIIDIEKLRQDSLVDDAITKNIRESGAVINKFRQLEGNNPDTQLKQQTDSLTEIRQNNEDSLQSAYAKRKFRQGTIRRYGYDVVESGLHAATELRKEAKKTRGAYQDALVDDAIANSANEGKLNTNFNALIQSAIEESKDAGGTSKEAIQENIKNKLGPAITRVANDLALHDPEKARHFVDSWKEYMHSPAYLDALEKVRTRGIDFYAETEGAKIEMGSRMRKQSGEEQTMLDTQKIAEDTAERIAKSQGYDAVSKQQLTDKLIQNVNKRVSVQQRALNDQIRSLKIDTGQTMSKPTSNGRPPIDMREAMTIDPHFADKVQRLVETVPNYQRILDSQFIANGKQDIPWSPEREANYAKFLGADDETRMKMNPAQMFVDGQVTRTMSNDMIQKQADTARRSETQQAAERVLARHVEIMNDANAFPSRTDPAANERYKWLKGAAQLRMERFAIAKKAPMSRKDEDEMMNDLVKEAVTGRYDRWIGIPNPFGIPETAPKFEREGNVKTITTKEERDALPEGSVYWFNGKKAQKPYATE